MTVQQWINDDARGSGVMPMQVTMSWCLVCADALLQKRSRRSLAVMQCR